MDEELIEALARAGQGRLSFDHAERRLSHRREDGGCTPVFATAAELRSLMQLILFRQSGPRPRDRTILDIAAELLLDHLDRHPVHAVLGMEHLRRSAMGYDDLAVVLGGPVIPARPEGSQTRTAATTH